MRRHLLPWLALMILIATSACAKNPPRPAAAPDPGPITLKVGVFVQGTGLEPVITAFTAAHPGYHIETVSFDTVPGLAQAVKEGRVDLFRAFGREGAADLEPYMRKSGFDTTPLGSLIDSLRDDGQIRALPIYGNPYVLVYNKQLVAEAGISIPTDALTWDHLREIAQKLTRGEGAAKQWGMSLPFNPAYVAYALAQEQAGAGRPVQPEHVEAALRYVQTLTFTDQSLPVWQTKEPPPLYFEQGQAAFSYMGLSTLRRLPADQAPGVAPPPARPGGKPVVLLEMTAYAIAANSANADAAWAFLAFAAGPEGATAMAKAGYFPLYATGAVQQAWLDVTPPPPPGLEPVLKAAWFPMATAISSTSPFGIFHRTATDVLTGGGIDDAMRLYRADMAAMKQ